MQHSETITKKENCNKRYEINIIRKGYKRAPPIIH
jgi:hypothetical protein